MHLLIVLMGSLGDVVRGFSLLPPIKAAQPDWKISWLVEPASAQLVVEHPLIDRCIVFERQSPWSGALKLTKALRAEHFDLVLDLQRHFKSGVFSRLTGAPVRIGFNPKNTKEGNWIFNNQHVPFFPNDQSKIYNYQLFLDELNVPKLSPLQFGIEPLIGRELKTIELPAQPYVGVVIGARWESKKWVLQGYAELIRRISAELRAVPVLLGSPSEREAAEQLAGISLAGPAALNLVGKTNLLELLQILGRAECSVGPDSGPAHLAVAAGRPYVTIFGPTDPKRVAPYRAASYTVSAKIGCHPCWQKKCPGLDRLCMRLVSVDQVFEQVKRAMLQGLDPVAV